MKPDTTPREECLQLPPYCDLTSVAMSLSNQTLSQSIQFETICLSARIPSVYTVGHVIEGLKLLYKGANALNL